MIKRYVVAGGEAIGAMRKYDDGWRLEEVANAKYSQEPAPMTKADLAAEDVIGSYSHRPRYNDPRVADVKLSKSSTKRIVVGYMKKWGECSRMCDRR